MRIIAVLLLGLLAFRSAERKIKVYLIGDSTMCLYEPERAPLTGWGMPFASFFDSSVVVDNRAKGGRSTRTFISENRWQPIVDELREGDYVFIQFGHNDEAKEERYKDRYTSIPDYKANLIRFINDTRAKSATPVLITPVSRMRFDKEGNAMETHSEYSNAVIEIALSMKVGHIDLDKKSRELYQSYGKDHAKLLFNYHEPGIHPGYPEGLKDNTHFNDYGARKIAQLVLSGMRELNIPLVTRVRVAQEYIPLWPAGKKPNSNGGIVTDSLYNQRIWRVGVPGMYAFPAPASLNTGTAVVICPGGGYERLSHIYNGFVVANWFNAHGINAFVLIYRLPHQSDLVERETGPLVDAQRAIKLIRANALKWNLNSSTIGVFGMSAGGHVAAMAGSFGDIAMIKDSVDKFSARPDFMVLVSPVISMGPYAHAGSKKNLLGLNPTKLTIDKYSLELQVKHATPPTFIVHALNDSSVSVQNSILMNEALIRNRVAASLHVFPQGGHGINMTNNPGSTDLFPQLLLTWMREMKFLKPLK